MENIDYGVTIKDSFFLFYDQKKQLKDNKKEARKKKDKSILINNKGSNQRNRKFNSPALKSSCT